MYALKFFILVLTAVGGFCYSIDVLDFLPEVLPVVGGDEGDNSDFGLDIDQLLKKYSYPLETHEVITEDGYILTLHRIPHGQNESLEEDNQDRPSVFIMHPLLSSSIDMVNLGPHKSIGLLLADEGYDVWLGNIRGNTWSRRHVSLNPDLDREFWDFSFEESALYDIPAKIDYILNVTGHENLTYLGHSQGTTVFFAMVALKPEYNDKINAMVAFAPVSYLHNVTQPLIRFLADFYFALELLTDVLNINEILPHTKVLPQVVKAMCCDECPFQDLCVDFIAFLVGSDPSQVNKTFLEVLGSNAPAGASTKMFKHFLQEINSGHFRRYDYGLKENLRRYNSLAPPDYNVSLISVPVALYYGGKDAVCPPVNVELLAEKLPNVVENRLINYFNHLDFIWAKDADTILYNDVIKLINTYNNNE